MPLDRALSVLLLIVSAVHGASAQQNASGMRLAPVELAGASVGSNALDGALVGGGPTYSVRFEPGAFWFTPLFGRSVPVDQPVGFELLSIERAGQTLYRPTAAVAPSQGASEATFERGGGIRERYELRADGVEQSFVFDEPLAGAGDLVVRGRLTSPLMFPADGEHAGGLSLEYPGVGWVSWGGVTGIDADGRRAAGSLRLAGEILELRLPADFVDGASYPLVLDPLVAGGFVGSDPLGVVTDPDVAYDQTFACYLVVWTVPQSASTTLVRAQRVSFAGNLLGGMLTLAATLDNERARVADVNKHNRFLVVWKAPFVFGGYVLTGMAVPATASLAPSSPALLAFGDELDSHALGGEGDALVHQKALVAWEEQGDVHATLVDVPMTGSPAAGTDATLLGSDPFGIFELPALSRTNGSAGTWQLAYRNSLVPLAAFHQVSSILVDRTGAPVGTSVGISAIVPSSTSLDEIHTDGDGTRFVTAWMEFGGLNQARAQRVVAGQLQQDHPAQAVDVGSALRGLAFGPHKTFLATVEPGPPCGIGGLFAFNSLKLIGIDPESCQTCETIQSVQSGCGATYDIALASEHSGGDTTSDRSLLAGRESSGSELFGQLFEELGAGGAPANLGGKCGLGGTIGTLGPVAVGNSTFQCTLTGADPASPLAFLNVTSNAVVPLMCGPCAWNPFHLIWTRVPIGGAASLPVPIPCDVALYGAAVQAQWTVLSPAIGVCPAFPGVALSDRLRLTLGS